MEYLNLLLYRICVVSFIFIFAFGSFSFCLRVSLDLIAITAFTTIIIIDIYTKVMK